jgi:hypothetical protein
MKTIAAFFPKNVIGTFPKNVIGSLLSMQLNRLFFL